MKHLRETYGGSVKESGAGISECAAFTDFIELIQITMEITTRLKLIRKNIRQYTGDHKESHQLIGVMENMELILVYIMKKLSADEDNSAADFFRHNAGLCRTENSAFIKQFPSGMFTGLNHNSYFDCQCEKYHISVKERETIRLLIKGFLYKEISPVLNISVNTLKDRVKSIYKKCNVQNKLELANLFCHNLN